MKKLKLFLLLLFLFLADTVFAAPVISAVSGTLAHEQSYIITGGGFGAKSTAAPVEWENFETDWQPNDFLNTRHGWSWRIGGANETADMHPKCVLDQSRSGSSQSARFVNKRDTASGWVSTRQYIYKTHVPIGTSRTLFLSAWIKPQIDENWVPFDATNNPAHTENWNSQQLKLFHIAKGDPFDDPCYAPNVGKIGAAFSGIYSFMKSDLPGVPRTYPQISQSSSHGQVARNETSCLVTPNCEGPVFASGTSLFWDTDDNRLWPVNTWHHVEVQLDPGAVGEAYTGSIRIWVDGMDISEPAWRQNFVRYYRNEDCYKMNMYDIGSYLANSYAGYAEIFYDDIYFDTAWQRILVCDAPAWDDTVSRHCEIQIPHTAWNNTQIQFKANQGSFSSGSQLYLYVIDGAGEVSNAYPVVFSGQPADSIAPAAPVNLTLQ